MQEQNIDKRLAICNSCPIYNPIGGRCNSNLWLNPDTNEVSTHARIGFIRGCNCFIEIKAKNPHNHCIAGKW